jgi:hypothetical protein
MDDNIQTSGIGATGQFGNVVAAPVNNLTSGIGATGQFSNVVAAPVSNLAGSVHLIFDVPQVVNVTYQANTNYRTTGYSGYSADLLHNDPINRTDFRLVQGVINEIFFFVYDSARSPVPNANLTINLTCPNSLLVRAPLSVRDSARGLYLLILQPDDIAAVPLGSIGWSISYQRYDLSTVLLWTDRNSPYSTAMVSATPTPMVPTQTIPWAEFSPLTAPPGFGYPIACPQYYSSPLLGAAQRPYAFGMQSFVVYMTGFTGTIEVDGTLCAQPDDSASSADWFPLFTANYTSVSVDDTITIQGCYVWVRMVVTLVSGSLIKVEYDTSFPTINQSIIGVAGIGGFGRVGILLSMSTIEPSLAGVAGIGNVGHVGVPFSFSQALIGVTGVGGVGGLFGTTESDSFLLEDSSGALLQEDGSGYLVMEPTPSSTFLFEDGSGSFLLEDASGYLLQES